MTEPNKESALTTADPAGGGVAHVFNNSGGTAISAEPTACPLFASQEGNDFRVKWQKIQTSFVDEPRKSVTDANALVDTAITRLTQIFADERNKLEHEWDRGDNVSTEDLRIALRRYHAFFDRLLSV